MRKKILNSVLFLCFLGGVIFSSAFVHAAAAVWYVDGSAPGGDGTSWSSAFNNIQDAINACSPTWIPCMAPATEQIWVKAGTYSLAAQINVDRYVTIYGGFNGTETSSSQRDWKNNITIVNGNDFVRCFYITEPATIDGFNIRRGRASNAGDACGGGIYIDSPPVYCSTFSFYHVARIKNCNINHNTAELQGGGINDIESDPVITNCIFLGNYATTGGGMKNWKSSPVIEKCRFEANRATIGGYGGAIYSDYLCYGTITNCIFYLNEASSHGGAIAYHMAYPYITNCTFSKNEAAVGGAIYTNTGGPRVKNCIFWDNTPDEILSEFTSSTWPYVKYSDIKGGYSGTGSNNIDNDPEFVNPSIDLHLQPGSPCIDTGTNTGAPSDDMDGLLRPQDGDGDGTAVCDMGAYEVSEPECPCEGDFDYDGDVDGSDLAIFAADFGRTDCP